MTPTENKQSPARHAPDPFALLAGAVRDAEVFCRQRHVVFTLHYSATSWYEVRFFAPHQPERSIEAYALDPTEALRVALERSRELFVTPGRSAAFPDGWDADAGQKLQDEERAWIPMDLTE